MGQFLANVRSAVLGSSAQNIANNLLLNNSLPKLKEFHGSFKSVCDNFSIDLTEFEQIFGSNEDSFQLWDTDNNGSIDALELFSGLILFSEAKFEEKIRFLFDLFDFNEMNFLEFVNIVFLIISCANATYKIYEINSQEVSDEEISNFLNNYFTDESKINVNQFFKWCSKVPEINEFFALIKKDIPLNSKFRPGLNAGAKIIHDNYVKHFGEESNNELPEKAFEPKALGNVIHSNDYKLKIEWLSTLSKKIFIPPGKRLYQNKDISVKINWVYGIRTNDVHKTIEYIPAVGTKSATEKIIYFVACTVIIYFPKLNEQKHYTEHEKEIISMSVAKNSSLAATGEYGDHPSVHVWNTNTLQNVGILKGIHQKGVHLLTFFHDDDYLATCGLRAESPIIIYNLKDFSLLLSTYVKGSVIDVFASANHFGEIMREESKIKKREDDKPKKPDLKKPTPNAFIATTSWEVVHFSYINGHFITNETNIKRHGIKTKICCGTAFEISVPMQMAAKSRVVLEDVLMLLTGHESGQVFVWRNLTLNFELCNYKFPIIKILSSKMGILITTQAASIHIWSQSLKQNTRNIDLHSLSFRLFSHFITDIAIGDDKIIFTTGLGDVVELSLSEKKETIIQKSMVNKIKSQRYNSINKTCGKLNTICVLDKSQDEDEREMFVAGDSGIVYGFSIDSHELINIFELENEQIKAMDAIILADGRTLFAIGCKSGNLYLKYDKDEKVPPKNLEKEIMDIKFSGDKKYLAVACLNMKINIFIQDKFDYLTREHLTHQFENEIPLSVVFTDENKSLLVGTSIRNQYKIDFPELKAKNLNQENDLINTTFWNLRYPLHTKTLANGIDPFILGGDIRLFVGSHEAGLVFYMKDREQLDMNCGGFLRGHASQLSRLTMTKKQDYFYSLGLTDNTIIEWRAEFVEDFLDVNTRADAMKNSLEIQINKDKIDQMVSQYQPLLEKEQQACSFMGNLSDKFKDTFTLFRGTNQKTLNLLMNIKIPSFEEKNYLMKRPPPLSINLDYVYGFQGADKRKCLFYIHIFSGKDKKQAKAIDKKPINAKKDIKRGESYVNIPQGNPQSIMIPEHMQKEMLLAKQTLLPYDETHEDCQRFFVYFTSRVAVIFDPVTGKQRFYEGHKFKITCMAVHPSKYFVASGEAAANPSIHLWNVLNTEPYKLLKTNHRQGVLNIAFSKDGNFIISLGMDKSFSIQITNWKTEETVAIRNSGEYPIFDLMFNPYNKYEFITGGYQNLSIWEINGKNLLRKCVVNLKETSPTGAPCLITCVGFISYNLGNVIVSDIICGNNFGDLGLVAHGKYITVKSKAHEKMINCLKITEVYSEKTIIISAGEDEYIRIWDTKFCLINEISLRDKGVLNNVSRERNISPQSLDVFFCRPPGSKKKDELSEPTNPILLFGTRNGDILEAGFALDFTGITVSSQKNAQDEVENSSSSEEEENDQMATLQRKKKNISDKIKNFSFNYTLYIRSHSSQTILPRGNNNNKKVFFTLHPKYPVMASVGDDQNLFIWDLENNLLIDVINIGKGLTCVKFSRDGLHIVVGFDNGLVMLFDFLIKKPKGDYMLEKKPESYCNFRENELKSPVLNIEFSPKGDLFAVSFHSAKPVKEKSEREKCYIIIFNLDKILSGKTSATKGIPKELLIRPGSLNYDAENIFNVGVFNMVFSEDQKYLMIQFQIIDSDLIRLNNDPQSTYSVWDLTQNISHTNYDLFKTIQLTKYNFPNAINCQYQFYQNFLTTGDETLKDALDAKLPNMTMMLEVDDYIICGSANGEILLVRKSCLFADKDFLTEFVSKENMCLAKSYATHISYVNQCELTNNNNLITSGIVDECLMKWKLNREDVNWDLDYNEYNIEKLDKFPELRPKEKFLNMINQVLPLRDDIYDVAVNVDDSVQPEYDIYLENIIGRKAAYSRNNLFYDYDERVIYIAGCNLVITNFESSSDNADIHNDPDQEENYHLKQEFIKVDSDNPLSSSPEVSALALTKDKKLLCAGTHQSKAKIIVWDICSRTCIKHLSVLDSSLITNIRWAYDNRHICCTAITKDYKQNIFLIDTLSGQILGCANFPFSSPAKLKDLEFFPNSIYKFATCGRQHMAVWTFKGSTFSYYNLEIANPKDLVVLKKWDDGEMDNEDDDDDMNSKRKADENQLKATFMCIVFVNEAKVTGADDGFLYIWDNYRVVTKQNAHPKAPILCLNASRYSPIFVSGGMDGRVILWELSADENNKLFIEKYYEYNISVENPHPALDDPDRPKEAIEFPKNHVQSVCIGSRYILAGMKTGDIYELVIPDESEVKQTTKINQDMVKLRMNSQDDETVKAIGFSANSDKLYTITERGQFCIWDLKTLSRLICRHFNLLTLAMLVCKSTPKIIIAFEREIQTLKNEEDFPYNEKYSIQFSTNISDMKMSYHERMLAVALATGTENAKIRIYDSQNDSDGFIFLCEMDNLSTSIDFLDFSYDNFYLLYKDNFEEVVKIDLTNMKKVQNVEFDIEWCGDGIKVSEKTKGIQSYYSDENKFLKIQKIGDQTIIVTDEMGTIRIFSYPCEAAGPGYLKCYSDHLNFIRVCMLSYDRNYLVTGSDMDKCLMIWRIRRNKQLEEKMDTFEKSDVQDESSIKN